MGGTCLLANDKVLVNNGNSFEYIHNDISYCMISWVILGFKQPCDELNLWYTCDRVFT